MHRVKYASVGGVLTGKRVGDTVEIHDAEELKHLLDLGLIETEEAYEERQAALVADLGLEQGLLGADKSSPAFPPLTDEQRLAPYAKGGGWYHFSEGEVLTKLRREEALVKLAALEAARAAGQQPAGQ